MMWEGVSHRGVRGDVFQKQYFCCGLSPRCLEVTEEAAEADGSNQAAAQCECADSSLRVNDALGRQPRHRLSQGRPADT